MKTWDCPLCRAGWRCPDIPEATAILRVAAITHLLYKHDIEKPTEEQLRGR